MKPYILYKINGVQGEIINGEICVFSVNDDLVDNVEIIQSRDSIEGIKVFLKESILLTQDVLLQTTSKVEHFFVNIHGKLHPSIRNFDLNIEQIYNPNLPDGAHLELCDSIHMSESYTIIRKHKIDVFKELFELQPSRSNADEFYMLFLTS